MNFGAGNEYIKKTERFWKAVREEWAHLIRSNRVVSLKKSVEAKPLFMNLFSLAEEAYDEELNKKIKSVINSYVN